MHFSAVNSSLSSSAISPAPTATMTPNSTVHYSSATSTLNKVDSYIVHSIQLDRPITSKYTARVDRPSTSKHDPYTVQLTQVGDATTYIEPKPSSAAVLANSPTVRVIDASTSTLLGIGSTVSEKRQTTTQSIPWRLNTPISPPTVGGVSEVCEMI